MGKGKETRERIIEQTAPLFNQMGFFGSSLTDIMKVTGLKKGGIYNHFDSKEDLALQAFDHAAGCASQKILASLVGRETAIDKLEAFCEVFVDNFDNPPIAGGCPLLNTAVQSLDAHPALRERVREAMSRWSQRVSEIVLSGIESGEFRADVSSSEVSSVMIATLEGGLMLSMLYEDRRHVERSAKFVCEYLGGLCA